MHHMFFMSRTQSTWNFFEDYKKLEKKPVEVLGFKNKKVAYHCITESIVRYEKEIKPTLDLNK